MKNRFKYFLKLGSTLILILAIFYSCKNDPIIWKPKSEELVISQYVETNDEFSEFFGLIESTGVSSLLAVRGPFTLFLPNNDAMNAYYAEKGISSYTNLSMEEQTTLAMNHVVEGEIGSGSIGLGALIEVNGIGDYLVSEFDGSDIIINKNSRIIDRDIIAANGVIHQVNKVLDPVTKSVYQVLADNPGYSIFKQGLDMTGLKDTLNVIDFIFNPAVDKTARTRFTILAVADTTFQRFGINSIDDLIATYDDGMGDLTDMENGFYRYMEYHCLSQTYYLSDLDLGTKNYPVLSYDNNVSVTVDDDYKINLDTPTKKYTGFIIELCNNPGKNGTFHTINGLLPVIQPKPTTVVWETTDHFDMKQLDEFGFTYARFFDGQNDFANIKWEGNYLLYYFKDHDTGSLLNDDCLSMSGWWWCQVKTPKIMKGKYKIGSNLWSGNINYAVYVDGVNTALIKRSDPANSTSWGEFDWTRTEEHTIKVVATSPGMLFWDTITFTPIN
jgi:uncharacterized surface protein with fasciclin (FAS1) repeats